MGSIFKGTTDEFKDVADAIRDINGEEEIYQWPEEYIAKLGEIKNTMTEYEDNYDDIIDAIKDIIKDGDPDDAEAIDEADVGPEDIVDAISGDGILIDEEEEEYAPSIVDIIADLKDALDLYTEDYGILEIGSDQKGLTQVKRFIDAQEKNRAPRVTDPAFAEKAAEVRTTKKLAIYICKAIYESGKSIICVPARYDGEVTEMIDTSTGVEIKVPWREFSFAIFVYNSADGAGYHFYDDSSTLDNLRLIGGTKMVRVVLSNV